MRNLDRSRRYTKTQGVTCNSSNLKPKRTGHMDTWGRKETVKIEAMKEHFEPKDRKKKVPQGLHRSPTETRERNWHSERHKMLSHIEDTMCNLQAHIDH